MAAVTLSCPEAASYFWDSVWQRDIDTRHALNILDAVRLVKKQDGDGMTVTSWLFTATNGAVKSKSAQNWTLKQIFDRCNRFRNGGVAYIFDAHNQRWNILRTEADLAEVILQNVRNYCAAETPLIFHPQLTQSSSLLEVSFELVHPQKKKIALPRFTHYWLTSGKAKGINAAKSERKKGNGAEDSEQLLFSLNAPTGDLDIDELAAAADTAFSQIPQRKKSALFKSDYAMMKDTHDLPHLPTEKIICKSKPVIKAVNNLCMEVIRLIENNHHETVTAMKIIIMMESNSSSGAVAKIDDTGDRKPWLHHVVSLTLSRGKGSNIAGGDSHNGDDGSTNGPSIRRQDSTDAISELSSTVASLSAGRTSVLAGHHRNRHGAAKTKSEPCYGDFCLFPIEGSNGGGNLNEMEYLMDDEYEDFNINREAFKAVNRHRIVKADETISKLGNADLQNMGEEMDIVTHPYNVDVALAQNEIKSKINVHNPFGVSEVGAAQHKGAVGIAVAASMDENSASDDDVSAAVDTIKKTHENDTTTSTAEAKYVDQASVVAAAAAAVGKATGMITVDEGDSTKKVNEIEATYSLSEMQNVHLGTASSYTKKKRINAEFRTKAKPALPKIERPDDKAHKVMCKSIALARQEMEEIETREDENAELDIHSSKKDTAKVSELYTGSHTKIWPSNVTRWWLNVGRHLPKNTAALKIPAFAAHNIDKAVLGSKHKQLQELIPGAIAPSDDKLKLMKTKKEQRITNAAQSEDRSIANSSFSGSVTSSYSKPTEASIHGGPADGTLFGQVSWYYLSVPVCERCQRVYRELDRQRRLRFRHLVKVQKDVIQKDSEENDHKNWRQIEEKIFKQRQNMTRLAKIDIRKASEKAVYKEQRRVMLESWKMDPNRYTSGGNTMRDSRGLPALVPNKALPPLPWNLGEGNKGEAYARASNSILTKRILERAPDLKPLSGKYGKQQQRTDDEAVDDVLAHWQQATRNVNGGYGARNIPSGMGKSSKRRNGSKKGPVIRLNSQNGYNENRLLHQWQRDLKEMKSASHSEDAYDEREEGIRAIDDAYLASLKQQESIRQSQSASSIIDANSNSSSSKRGVNPSIASSIDLHNSRALALGAETSSTSKKSKKTKEGTKKVIGEESPTSSPSRLVQETGGYDSSSIPPPLAGSPERPSSSSSRGINSSEKEFSSLSTRPPISRHSSSRRIPRTESIPEMRDLEEAEEEEDKHNQQQQQCGNTHALPAPLLGGESNESITKYLIDDDDDGDYGDDDEDDDEAIGWSPFVIPSA